MPYALCPMPYAQSYLIFLIKAISSSIICEQSGSSNALKAIFTYRSKIIFSMLVKQPCWAAIESKRSAKTLHLSCNRSEKKPGYEGTHASGTVDITCTK